jgi:N-acetyl-gamma-glutamyl-phosphate reductase
MSLQEVWAMEKKKLSVAILGASGYTGAELIRLLLGHPEVQITVLTAERSAGQPLAAVFPQFAPYALPDLVKIGDVNWDGVDFVFCALPHGTTQEVIAALPPHLKIVDLSADFRLADIESYATWYGHAHKAPHLQSGAVYGLTELAAAEVATARLVANPGCYPTSAQLPLIPLLRDKLIETGPIIIDSKSGVSGAGRDAKQGSLFTEVADGIHAYGIATHRHTPEIEQGLSLAAGEEIRVSFTPHLMPMSRGILSTIYVQSRFPAEALWDCLSNSYKTAPFVHVLPLGQTPATRHVRGSNHCSIGLVPGRLPGQTILVAAIDNLMKGASGQAVQNMNVMMGWDQTLGLGLAPVFP